MKAKRNQTASIEGQGPAGAHQQESATLRRQADYMRAFQDVMLAVTRRVDPLEVLETLLKNTIELMQTIHGFYYQYEAETDTLVLKVGFGFYQRRIGSTTQKGEGLIGKVWQDEKPIVANDYQAWPGRNPAPTWDAVHSAAGVPVQLRGVLLGVVGILHTDEGQQIADHEFELLNRFADLAAIALDKARVDAQLEAELRERRQAEAALTKSEERHRSVVEDLSEFILRWRPDGHILFTNDAYCRYKGKTRAEVIDNNVAQLFSKIAHDQARKIIARLTPDHPLEASEIFKLDFDNQPIWEEWTDRGIFDEAGRLTEIQSVGRNITVRKLAEKALRESENRFYSFFNSNPEGIILVDLEGHILDANRSLLKMTGYRLDEIQGRAYQSLVHAEFYPKVARNIEAMQNGLVQEDTIEVEYVSKAGASIPVEVRGWVITDEKSQPVAIGGFIRDITRERLLTADKAALEGQLQQTQKMEAIGTLAGGIAHDFNNILSGILGYAELALEEADNSKTALMHYLTGVLDACRRARDLVQQILKFSRRDDSALMPLSLAPLLKEAVKLLRSTLPATIQVKENITAELDTVIADATQLHQVIMNLGANAYHAMRETGGILTFSLQNLLLAEPKYFMTLTIPPGDYIKLSISDTGPGIPDEMQERIFEPYFTTKEKQEGTGLGLSVTFGIIKNLNGLIEVEQSAAGSTTFVVYLPLGKKAGTRAPSRSHRLPRGRNQRILCIDDEKIFLEVVQTHLEGLGYQVKACPSSVQALEYLQADPAAFDLIITDQTMPEMTGVQLAADIREINKTLPLILCTGYSEAVTAQAARRLGIASILMKPITRSELARTVHRVLREKKPRPGADQIGS